MKKRVLLHVGHWCLVIGHLLPMYFFELAKIAARSIRQRGVASLLTMFSMSLGVTLVVAGFCDHLILVRTLQPARGEQPASGEP